jgi:spore coat protein U-like protein
MRTDWRMALVVLAVLTPSPAVALLCGTVLEPVRVTATPLSFGLYAPSATGNLFVSSTISLDCGLLSLDLLPSFTLALSAGNAGTPSARYMLMGASRLNYNLYTTAAHTTVWDDSANTQSYSALLNLGTVSYTAYGAVFAGQYVPAGTYNDTITVTVNY